MHAKILKLVNHVMGLSLAATISSRSLARSGTSQTLHGHTSSTLRLCQSRAGGVLSLNERRSFSRIPAQINSRRYLSWLPKLGTGLRPQHDQFNGPMDNQEEAAKVAILEKAMKGRQPTDLKLRCKLRSRFLTAVHV